MTQIDTHRTAAPAHDRELIPRMMARAMLALVVAVLVLVALARATDQPLVATAPTGDIVASRSLLLSGDMSGAVTVRKADGALIADLGPDRGGFISGVWRVIERERTKNRVTLEGPVTLRRHDTGRLSIHDPSTGWSADLMGFGEDNARAFARLLAQ